MKGFECALEYPREILIAEGFPYSGKWNSELFGRECPITLELGCGKGEYTVGLALADSARNFVGVDIKGARMWTGAKEVEEKKIPNARFLRTEIENIDKFFSEGEVDSLWITFPDPQMQKTRKRLTSTRYLNLYRKIMKDNGMVNLKTDSPFLYEYTRRLTEVNGLEVTVNTDDLYGSGLADETTSIKTFYEQQWLSRGKKIKLLCFRLPHDKELVEPEIDDIERDDYRSQAGRHVVTL